MSHAKEKTGSPIFDAKFGPLFFTQFLGAFNDNLFKNALVITLTFSARGNTRASPRSSWSRSPAARSSFPSSSCPRSRGRSPTSSRRRRSSAG